MKRTQIQLDERTYELLRRKAFERGCSISAYVREVLAVLLGSAPAPERRSIRAKAGPRLAREAETHVRSEHSTYDWVMEGLLRRGGFRIVRKQYGDGFQASYVCTRA